MTSPERERWLSEVKQLAAEVERHDGPPDQLPAMLSVLSELERQDLLWTTYWLVSLTRPILLEGGTRTLAGVEHLSCVEIACLGGPTPEPAESPRLASTPKLSLAEDYAIRAAHLLRRVCGAHRQASAVPLAVATINLTAESLTHKWFEQPTAARHLEVPGSRVRAYYQSDEWRTTYRGCWQVVCARLQMLAPPDTSSPREDAP